MQNETIHEAKETPSPQRRQRKKSLLVTLGKVFILLLLATVITVLVYPAPVLRAVFSRVEAQSGISLTFDRAYFSLSGGAFLCLDGLTVQRLNHSESNFTIRADRVRMPAMVPNDFRSPVLSLTGVRGIFERVGVGDENGENEGEGKRADGGIAEETKREDLRESDSREHHLQGLLLQDAEIDFIDHTLEKPFRATIQINDFTLTATRYPSLFAPYSVDFIQGQIDSAAFLGGTDKRVFALAEAPIGLFGPYAPVLDDIFVSGSMTIWVEDLTDALQKRARISITLLPDCKIKSADEILAPAIQAALQQLDQSAVSDLQDLRRKLERLKTNTESIRVELDRVVQVLDLLKMLAPRAEREKYEKFKSEYDRASANYDNWNNKLETLVQDLDRVKVRIVEETFQHFIQSGTPIEIELQEVDGEWHYDAYETVIRLVERSYRAIIAAEYQNRIQEIRDAVDRLLLP